MGVGLIAATLRWKLVLFLRASPPLLRFLSASPFTSAIGDGLQQRFQATAGVYGRTPPFTASCRIRPGSWCSGRNRDAVGVWRPRVRSVHCWAPAASLLHYCNSSISPHYAVPNGVLASGLSRWIASYGPLYIPSLPSRRRARRYAGRVLPPTSS